MFYVIYYLLWLINIFLMLFNKRSRVVVVLTSVLFFLLFTLNSGQTGDAYKYKMDYELNAFGADWSEIGYNLFKTFTHLIGLNTYNSFLIAIFVVSAVLIYRGMRLIDGNYHALYAVSMGFLFPMFATAIRFFMAFAIFVYALHFLYQNKKVKYIVFIIIAASLHRTALFFIVLPLCMSGKFYEIVSKKIVKRIEIGFLALITLICIVITYYTKEFPFADLIISTVSNIFPALDIKMNAYFGTMTRFGALTFFAVYFINLYASVIMRRSVARFMKKNGPCEFLYRFSESTFLCNAISIVTLPFLILNLAFFRFLVLPTFMNAILLGQILNYNKCKDIIKIDCRKCLFAICLVIAVWSIPEILAVNSITIHNMIESTLLGLQ